MIINSKTPRLFPVISAIFLILISCRHNHIVSTGPSWILHIPAEWHLSDQGKTSDISYSIYKRKPIIDRSDKKIIPACIITTEKSSRGTDLAQHALDEQSENITSMEIKGYKIITFRKDIQEELKTAFRINDIVSLAYEYQFNDVPKRFLTITVYAKKGNNLLNVSIESSSETYKFLRREIYQIISSIR